MNDKQQLAAMGAEMAEQQQQPLCMAKRIEELETQVRGMVDLLRDLHEHIGTSIPQTVSEHYRGCDLLERIDAALAGNPPSATVPEGWHIEALDNDRIVVRKDGVGFYVASINAENIASTILHALAYDMLAAAPKPEAK